MQKIARTLMAVLLAFACASTAFAQRGSFAEIYGADLETYPIRENNAPLTVKEIAELGLSPEVLEEPMLVENHFRNLGDKKGRFVVETLPVGTVILRGAGGEPIYKADCGNRIVEVLKPSSAPTKDVIRDVVPTTTPVFDREMSYWDHILNFNDAAWDALGDFFGGLWNLIKWSLGTLWNAFLILLLVGVFAGILAALLNWLLGYPWVSPAPRNEPPSTPPTRPTHRAHAEGIAAARRTNDSGLRPSDPANQLVVDREGRNFQNAGTSTGSGTTRPAATLVNEALVATGETPTSPTTPKPSDNKSDDVYMKWSAGTGNKPHDLLEWSGMHTVTFESEGGKCTLRFTPKR